MNVVSEQSKAWSFE